MQFRSVLHVLGLLLLLLGGLLLVPLIAAIALDDGHLALERYEVLGFSAAIAAAVFVGGALRTLCEIDLARIGNREGVAIVTLSWVVFSLVGSLPYVVTGAAGFTDAYFETMSGFTTTGASIFPEVELLPRGLLLWRAQTQWIGGMGIVVLSVAILPILGIGGYRMFKAELPGGSTYERNAPRIKDTAKVLWLTYFAMSLAEMMALYAAGMSGYDAICHTFTTMSTGGFSTRTASLAGWPAPAIQWTVIAFMFLAGVNFGIFHQLLVGPRRRVLRNSELKTYALVIALAVALFAAVLLHRGVLEGGEAALRAAAFQVVSIGTTTGFATEDFGRWPQLLQLLLLLLMFVGGCAGSTAGGMKVVRLLIYFKAAALELRRVILPRAVLVVRIGERPLERDVVANVMGFFAMYVLLFAAATVLLALTGMDLLSASSAAVANLSNIGPGLGLVGPAASYAEVSVAGKWVLILCQLLGRLEVYSVMALVLKRSWVR